MYPILYVDDEPDLLDIGKIFLETDGQFCVDTAISPSVALELMKAAEYEAVVSDYQMPGMNGIDLLRHIRASGNMIPFIIFTGKGREEVVIQALNEGADFYLQKGGHPEPQFVELAHKIRQAVGHRKAREKASAIEQREADILSFLPDATFAIDTSGNVIVWNRAMERITGVRASDILGKGNYEYALPFYNERRPVLADVVLTQDPAAKARYPFIKREGNTLFTEIIVPHFRDGRDTQLWFTASPLYDSRGIIIGAIESIRDTTDRRIAKESLLREQVLFDAVINAIPGAFFVLDRDGKIIRCNALVSEMLGTTGEDVRDTHALSFIVEDDRPAVERALSEVFSTGHGGIRARVRGRTSAVKEYVLAGKRITAGDEVYVVGTGTEVTEKGSGG